MITEKDLLDAGFEIDGFDPQFKYIKKINAEYDEDVEHPPCICFDVIMGRFCLFTGDNFIYTNHTKPEEIIRWCDEITEIDLN